MVEEDRVALVSDLHAVEARLENRIVDEGSMTRRNFEIAAGNMRELGERLEKRIVEDAEMTRRHFDISAESMRDTTKLVAELVAHRSTVLDNHENRLQKLEAPSRKRRG